MMRPDKGIMLVTGCALLTLSSVSLFFCPTARAGSPVPKVQPAHSMRPASPAPDTANGEDSLDDDRAEHWNVPAIVHEGQVQIIFLMTALVCTGALSARRRGRLQEKKRHE